MLARGRIIGTTIIHHCFPRERAFSSRECVMNLSTGSTLVGLDEAINRITRVWIFTSRLSLKKEKETSLFSFRCPANPQTRKTNLFFLSLFAGKKRCSWGDLKGVVVKVVGAKVSRSRRWAAHDNNSKKRYTELNAPLAIGDDVDSTRRWRRFFFN